MRDAFLKSLFRLAKKDPNVMLLTADLGYGVFEEFERQFPKQYLNVGVAEQNMVGVASGLALEGKKVFTYSIGNFPTLRCLEQIRNDACYHELNINIVASGGGFSYGGLGMSHHATEDISIMRALPGVTVLSPSTSDEVEASIENLYGANGVGYLRLDKTKSESNIPLREISIGKANILRSGNDIAMIVVGGIAAEVMKAAELLSHDNIECQVVSLYSVTPIDIEMVKSASKKPFGLITVEEGNLSGGVGSAISELCLDNNLKPKNFYRFGLNNEYSSVVGDQGYLRSYFGIDSESIVSKVKSLVLDARETPNLQVLPFKKNAVDLIALEKDKLSESILLQKDGITVYPVTWRDADNKTIIQKLTKWRSDNQVAFPKIFNVTEKGTRIWLKSAVLDRDDRILFIVRDAYGIDIGHIGISSFNYREQTCEIDNIVRGEVSSQSRVMELALKELLFWVFKKINPESIKLKVFNDNIKAMALYCKLGFKPIELLPMERVSRSDEVEWIGSKDKIDRFFVLMELKKV